ncbi:MAG: hypothetical protein KBC62_00180 [Candidatus Pacebacteria bacterium]|nr:hypothetical protein [Candidatus Paceibacterota bacterium]MBP9842404.1 hypothetical protein [Candidatus Paceibacterota bacterium]
MYTFGAIVRPTDETCRLSLRFHRDQRFTVQSATPVTPTNRHPLSGDYIGPSLGGEFMLVVTERKEPISSILVQQVH